MSRLYQIHEAVRIRADQILSSQTDWPCRKGCDDCCRRLASHPEVSREEWDLISAALDALPRGIAEAARSRIRESADTQAPVVCPLLDTNSGSCLVYDARPVACRAYGFYAERQYVLGCGRIESKARDSREVVWGNHAALQERMIQLGATATLGEWLGPVRERVR